MRCKLFEIRDRNTTIIALATQLESTSETERFMLGFAGYGSNPKTQGSYILLTKLNGGETECHYDPYGWRTPTMREAHLHIRDNWNDLDSGAVICTEFLRGERNAPKPSDFAHKKE